MSHRLSLKANGTARQHSLRLREKLTVTDASLAEANGVTNYSQLVQNHKVMDSVVSHDAEVSHRYSVLLLPLVLCVLAL